MSRIVNVEPLDCLAWQDGEHGTTFDDGVLWVLEKIGELPAVPTCDDAVSRQAAIKTLEKGLPSEPLKSKYTEGITVGFGLAITWIEQLPAVQPQTGWNNHTVACLLAELFGDTCACNYNGVLQTVPKLLRCRRHRYAGLGAVGRKRIC